MASYLGISGSPRKGGNTDVLVQTALRTLAEVGAETTFIRLADEDINPCKGCLSCKKEGVCVQKDGMQKIYELLNKARGIVVGSPVYFATVSAQTKCFVDRLIALIDEEFQPRLLPGKKAVLLFAQGDTNEDAYWFGLKPLLQTFEWLGVGVVGTLVVGGLDEAGVVSSREDILEKVSHLAGRLSE